MYANASAKENLFQRATRAATRGSARTVFQALEKGNTVFSKHWKNSRLAFPRLGKRQAKTEIPPAVTKLSRLKSPASGSRMPGVKGHEHEQKV